jgi:predicted acylesterase/phospholipase RssA
MRRYLPVIGILIISFTGCSWNAYTNEKIGDGETNKGVKAAYKVENRPESNRDALVILALSGGGSRAAVFSSSAMLLLDQLKIQNKSTILKEVDVISSVSGGSLPAAYYAISRDSEQEGDPQDRIWNQQAVNEVMAMDYIGRWVANFFWPRNILYYWFTAYNRSDIMATTFADNFLDSRIYGTDYMFKDIRPDRPSLVINSTNGTTGKNFGELFTFTTASFDDLHSNLGEYELARAVMASACFPAVFNYMHLRDFTSEDEKFVHIFDGGNNDNLGLRSTFAILMNSLNDYQTIILILVDTYTQGGGIGETSPDGRRGPLDFIADTNFIDSFDCLLSRNRENLIQNGINFFEWLKNNLQKDVMFYHLKFDNLSNGNKDLYRRVNNIKTDFQIDESDASDLRQASAALVTEENECLQGIRTLLSGGKVAFRSSYCTWPTLPEDMIRIDDAPKAPETP